MAKEVVVELITYSIRSASPQSIMVVTYPYLGSIPAPTKPTFLSRQLRRVGRYAGGGIGGGDEFHARDSCPP